MKKLILIALALAMFGCSALTGEEVGRLKIDEISKEDHLVAKEVTLDLKKNDEVAIWSDMDIAYEGDVAMRFKIELRKGDVVMGTMEIDPTKKDITIGEVQTSLGSKTNWSFTGRNKTITIGDNGKYTFKAIFISSENATLKVKRAEVVLKKL